MGIDYRIFAVRERELDELKSNPALVLGRSLLAGGSFCDLADAGAALALIVADSDEPESDPTAFLRTGGMELNVLSSAGYVPRLLMPPEVQSLHSALKPLTQLELHRRFSRQLLVSKVFDRLTSDGFGSSESRNSFEDCEEDSADDWTLDEAEEFERIAQQVESLRGFIAKAARRRQALVIALRETQ